MKISQIRNPSPQVSPVNPASSATLDERIKQARKHLAQVEADGEFLPQPPRTEEEYDIVDDYRVRLRKAQELVNKLDNTAMDADQHTIDGKISLDKIASRHPMEAMVNHMGENEIRGYGNWKRALKKIYPEVKFDGDKDICTALVGNKGIGEWDGEVGVVYGNKHTKRPLNENRADDTREYRTVVKDIDRVIADMRDKLIDVRADFESSEDRGAHLTKLKKVLTGLRGVVDSF